MRTALTAVAITAHATVMASIEPELPQLQQPMNITTTDHNSEALSKAQECEVVFFAEEIRSHSPLITDVIQRKMALTITLPLTGEGSASYRGALALATTGPITFSASMCPMTSGMTRCSTLQT